MSDVSAIGKGIGALTNLQHLVMNYSGCQKIFDVSSIGSGIEALTQLQHLELYFGPCEKLLNTFGASFA